MWYINGTRLDDRIIRTDWDAGFIEGRQYGRGKSGGQVRTSRSFLINHLRLMPKLTVASFQARWCYSAHSRLPPFSLVPRGHTPFEES